MSLLLFIFVDVSLVGWLVVSDIITSVDYLMPNGIHGYIYIYIYIYIYKRERERERDVGEETQREALKNKAIK